MSAMHEASGVEAPTVPGCEILGPLNEGGMGKVYLARQTALKRLVCVKVLAIPDGEDADLCRSRFNREAELLASVSHPHILSIFDFGTTSGSGLPFLITEYIEGGDLRRFMTPGQPMPVDRARSILLQVGEALAYLHSKGILHRDLKPENILMPTDSLVKVGDLGIAVLQEEAGVLTRSLRGMGTVGYVSPEQQYGLKVDERTDQYSLAALSYELLTGRRPLGLFPPPSRSNPRLSRAVDAAILRGLSEEPKDRFPSVRDFVAALDRGLLAPPWRARKRFLALVASFAVLFSAAGLALVLGFGSNMGAGIEPGPAQPDPAQPDRATDRPAADPVPPRAGKAANEPGAMTAEPSREITRLVELRAYWIWDRSGRPTGPAGEAVKEKNWLEAERQIRDEVGARAYQIWERQGRPTGTAGESIREINLRSAEAELLRETEAEFRRHPLP
jgi:eukaryotic-like serine/threonine-protein kinase